MLRQWANAAVGTLVHFAGPMGLEAAGEVICFDISLCSTNPWDFPNVYIYINVNEHIDIYNTQNIYIYICINHINVCMNK